MGGDEAEEGGEGGEGELHLGGCVRWARKRMSRCQKKRLVIVSLW